MESTFNAQLHQVTPGARWNMNNSGRFRVLLLGSQGRVNRICRLHGRGRGKVGNPLVVLHGRAPSGEHLSGLVDAWKTSQSSMSDADTNFCFHVKHFDKQNKWEITLSTKNPKTNIAKRMRYSGVVLDDHDPVVWKTLGVEMCELFVELHLHESRSPNPSTCHQADAKQELQHVDRYGALQLRYLAENI